MEIARILSHYRSMIDLIGDTDISIKETLIMQKYTMVYVHKDKLSDCPTLRQRLYLEALALQDNINSQNCKEQLASWINHCEGLGHSLNYESQTQNF
jgi:hypothetical protein